MTAIPFNCTDKKAYTAFEAAIATEGLTCIILLDDAGEPYIKSKTGSAVYFCHGTFSAGDDDHKTLAAAAKVGQTNTNVYIIEFFDVIDNYSIIGRMTSTTIADAQEAANIGIHDLQSEGYEKVSFKIFDFVSGITLLEQSSLQTQG